MSQKLSDTQLPKMVQQDLPGHMAQQGGMSTRQFERLFKRQVGVPAQIYRSIVRFRRIFDALAADATSLSDAAQIAGYADHPQMAREFKRFLGCSASDFLRQKTALAAAMTGAGAPAIS